MNIKLIFTGIMFVCAIIAFVIKLFIPEYKYKDNPMRRIILITRIRVGCYIIMMVLLLICLFI